MTKLMQNYYKNNNCSEQKLPNEAVRCMKTKDRAVRKSEKSGSKRTFAVRST
jgi:hypothetical protein